VTAQDYYPTVAITALMRIVKDTNLSVHHNAVLQAVMWIVQSLKARCVQFLPQVRRALSVSLYAPSNDPRYARCPRGVQVVPSFLHLMKHRGGETALRETLLQQLELLVRQIREHIRPYLPDIFRTIKDIWPECLTPLLKLVEAISEVRQRGGVVTHS
jgi:FKBP12-rapamycin complex-associated protein